MNNSCVVPLTETGMEIGDRHYIWGQNGSKFMTHKPFSYQENYIVMVYVCILLLYFFLFERGLITHMAYKVFQEYKFSRSVFWQFVSLLVRPSVRPFVNF